MIDAIEHRRADLVYRRTYLLNLENYELIIGVMSVLLLRA